MAVSLKTYKLNLNESQKKLQEIGQRLIPFQKEFEFTQGLQGIQSEFDDPQNNKIKVIFYEIKSSCFEIDFEVNGTSFGDDVKMEVKQFFLIISTVVECVNNFIQEFDPNQLKIQGSDKTGKEGQKDKIWMEYIKVNIKDNNYIFGIESDGSFGLQKKGLKRKY